MSRLTELRRSTNLIDRAPTIRAKYPEGPRGDFQMIVSWIQWMLRALCEHVPQAGLGYSLSGNYASYPQESTDTGKDDNDGAAA
jgi:hypothetical protein